jgi:hypothetical protein
VLYVKFEGFRGYYFRVVFKLKIAPIYTRNKNEEGHPIGVNTVFTIILDIFQLLY